MSYNERRESEILDDIQNNRPGAKERLRNMRKSEEEMRAFDQEYGYPEARVDAERSSITRLRRDIYDSLGD